jgi:hypothetical protein
LATCTYFGSGCWIFGAMAFVPWVNWHVDNAS